MCVSDFPIRGYSWARKRERLYIGANNWSERNTRFVNF